MRRTNFTTELLDSIKERYLNGESLTKLSKEYKCAVRTLSSRLKELGVEIVNRQNLVNYNLKDIIPLYENGMSLTQISKKFHTDRHRISKLLLDAGYEIVNKQNETKFNENVFDIIDTEEKAYWLGFIWADGTISSTPLDPNKKSTYNFELSLKGSDKEHLEKFNKFMEHIDSNHVRLTKTTCSYDGRKVICECCRWWIVNKHLWTTLNNYGCTPKKSLTLKFPDLNIFKTKYLVRDFIRGFFDGDGCISYSNKEHTMMNISFLGTLDMLEGVEENLPLLQKYKFSKNHDNNDITMRFMICGKNGLSILHFLYNNATIYLNRKYNKYLEYCRLYEKSCKLSQTNIGGGCDVNPETSIESKESMPS